MILYGDATGFAVKWAEERGETGFSQRSREGKKACCTAKGLRAGQRKRAEVGACLPKMTGYIEPYLRSWRWSGYKHRFIRVAAILSPED